MWKYYDCMNMCSVLKDLKESIRYYGEGNTNRKLLIKEIKIKQKIFVLLIMIF